MLNVSTAEILVVCVVALIVIGPERLPMAVKTASLWIGRFRRSFYKVKAEIERELNTDEIRSQLHNESVLAEIEEAKAQVKGTAKDVEKSMSNIVSSANFDPGASQSTDKQQKQQKSIQQELEEAGEHIEGISRSAYGTGKNPKLAEAEATAESPTQASTQASTQAPTQSSTKTPAKSSALSLTKPALTKPASTKPASAKPASTKPETDNDIR